MNCVSNFTAIRFLAQQRYAKNDNSSITCQLFSCAQKSTEAKNLSSLWLISYSAELCNKNCINKTSRTLIIWSVSCYIAGSYKSGCKKGVPDKLIGWLCKV